MRFIYLLLIGLIVFNGMIVLSGELFPDATDIEGAKGYEEYSEYGNLGSATFWRTFISVSLATFTVSILLVWAAKGSLPLGTLIGISAIVSIITGLWASAFQVVSSLPYMDNVIVWGIISLIIIATGIVTVLSFAEMFVGQTGAGT